MSRDYRDTRDYRDYRGDHGGYTKERGNFADRHTNGGSNGANNDRDRMSSRDYRPSGSQDGGDRSWGSSSSAYRDSERGCGCSG